MMLFVVTVLSLPVQMSVFCIWIISIDFSGIQVTSFNIVTKYISAFYKSNEQSRIKNWPNKVDFKK